MNNAKTLKTDRMHFFKGMKPLFLLLILFCAHSASAQRNLTLFGLGDVNQLNALNPGFIPEGEMFFGIPVISNMNVQYSNDAFNLSQFGLSGVDLRRSDYMKARPFTDTVNHAYGYATVDLASAGFLSGKNLYTISLTDHVDGHMQFPFALIDLIADGESDDVQMNKSYNLSETLFDVSYYRALSLGFARQFNERLSAGGQLKFLAGMANLRSENDGLMFSSLGGEGSFYEAYNRLSIYSSGLDMFQTGEGVPVFTPGNYGFALSLGGVYQATDRLKVQASVLDLGFLNWRSELSMEVLDQGDVKNEALGMLLQETYTNTEDTLIYAQRDGNSAYKTNLSTKVYAAFQYQASKEHSFGAVINPIFYRDHTNLAFSLSYRMKVTDQFRWNVSYSAFNGSFLNIGAGASLRVNNMQLYIASDNLMGLLVPGSTNNIHLNFGANIVFGREKQQKILAEKQKQERDAKRLAEAEAAAAEEAAAAASKGKIDPRVCQLTVKTLEGASGKALDEAAYVDVFKITGAGEREMVRTDRFPGSEFKMRLNRSEETYEMKISAYGYRDVLLRFTPNTEERSEVVKMIREEPAPKPAPAVSQAMEDISENEEEMAGEGSAETEVAQEGGAYLLTETTSLRTQPDSGGAVLKRFKTGDAVTLVEKTNQWWWKVTFQGQTGWVKVALLQPAN